MVAIFERPFCWVLLIALLLIAIHEAQQPWLPSFDNIPQHVGWRSDNSGFGPQSGFQEDWVDIEGDQSTCTRNGGDYVESFIDERGNTYHYIGCTFQGGHPFGNRARQSLRAKQKADIKQERETRTKKSLTHVEHTFPFFRKVQYTRICDLPGRMKNWLSSPQVGEPDACTEYVIVDDQLWTDSPAEIRAWLLVTVAEKACNWALKSLLVILSLSYLLAYRPLILFAAFASFVLGPEAAWWMLFGFAVIHFATFVRQSIVTFCAIFGSVVLLAVICYTPWIYPNPTAWPHVHREAFFGILNDVLLTLYGTW